MKQMVTHTRYKHNNCNKKKYYKKHILTLFAFNSINTQNFQKRQDGGYLMRKKSDIHIISLLLTKRASQHL